MATTPSKAKAAATASVPAPAPAPAPVVPPKPTGRPAPEIRRVADLLKQVSDPTRFQVLMLLNDKERNVSELCATTSAPRASRRSAITWPCSATVA